jgi:hypothetical protein
MPSKKSAVPDRSIRSVTRELAVLRRRVEAIEDRLLASDQSQPSTGSRRAGTNKDLARLMATLEFASREFEEERRNDPSLAEKYRERQERMHAFLRARGLDPEE